MPLSLSGLRDHIDHMYYSIDGSSRQTAAGVVPPVQFRNGSGRQWCVGQAGREERLGRYDGVGSTVRSLLYYDAIGWVAVNPHAINLGW